MDVSVTISDDIGEIKLHHSFNGAAPIGRGWMVCDGSIVNQASYDAIHGSGMYQRDCIGSSPIVGRNLPNFVNRYPVGVSATTQHGIAAAITPVGLTGHNLVIPAHNHQWYDDSGSNDKVFNSAGTPTGLSVGNEIGVAIGVVNNTETSSGTLNQDAYTTRDNALSQSVQPDSIQVIYKIKVI